MALFKKFNGVTEIENPCTSQITTVDVKRANLTHLLPVLKVSTLKN